MTEVEFSRLLADLSEHAQALNAESDSLNDLIEQAEARLKAMNLGLEVWLTRTADSISTRRLTEEEGDAVVEYAEDTELGYAKGPQGWGLYLREALYRVAEPVTLDSRNLRPLRTGVRQERVTALTRLPELFRALKAEADTALKSIRKAKELLK